MIRRSQKRWAVFGLALLGFILSMTQLFLVKKPLELNMDGIKNKSSPQYKELAEQWDMVIGGGVVSVVFPFVGMWATIKMNETLNLVYGILSAILFCVNISLAIYVTKYYWLSVVLYLFNFLLVISLYKDIRRHRIGAFHSAVMSNLQINSNINYSVPGQSYPAQLGVTQFQTNNRNGQVYGYPIQQSYKNVQVYQNGHQNGLQGSPGNSFSNVSPIQNEMRPNSN